MPAGTFTPSFTRRGEGEDNASSLIRSADFPIRASHRGSKVVQQSWPVFSSLELDQGGSRYVSQNRYGRGFSWGADNGNFGSWGTLARIWEIHASVEDDQPPCPKRTIPFYIHGDEGRGQCKRPLLVLTFQPVLGWQKDATINKEDAMNSKKPLNPDQKYRLCDAWLHKKCLIGCGLCYSVSWLDATTHPGQLRRDIETQMETSASFILNPASRKPIFFQSPCLVAWYRRSTWLVPFGLMRITSEG